MLHTPQALQALQDPEALEALRVLLVLQDQQLQEPLVSQAVEVV
jgi:hypothetical protein